MKLTLKDKAEHYNNMLLSPALNKAGFEKVTKFASHNKADEAIGQLLPVIEKAEGYKIGPAGENGLPTIAKIKADKPAAKGSKGSNKAKIASDEQTTKLVETVILSETARGDKWSLTGEWIWDHKAIFTKDGSNAKGNRKVAWDTMDSKSGGVELPEFVEHHSTGKQIKLRNNSGKVQWSSWKMTRRWAQNVADIFNALERAGWDKVFPNGKLATRTVINELMKKQKSPETPIKTISRNADMILKKMEELEATEENIEALKQIMATLNADYQAYLAN